MSITGPAVFRGSDLPEGPTIIVQAGIVDVASAILGQIRDRRRVRLAVARHGSGGALRE